LFISGDATITKGGDEPSPFSHIVFQLSSDITNKIFLLYVRFATGSLLGRYYNENAKVLTTVIGAVMEIFKNAKLNVSESKGSWDLGIDNWGKNSCETKVSRHKDRDNWVKASLTFPCRNSNSAGASLKQLKVLQPLYKQT